MKNRCSENNGVTWTRLVQYCYYSAVLSLRDKSLHFKIWLVSFCCHFGCVYINIPQHETPLHWDALRINTHKKVPQPWAKNHPEKKRVKQETDSCYSSKKPTGFLQTIRVGYDVVCLEVFQNIFGATWYMYLELLQPKQGSFGLSLLEGFLLSQSCWRLRRSCNPRAKIEGST